MKKELKDYLHFYLGANYYIRWIKTKRTSRKRRKGVVSYGGLHNIFRALNNPEYYEVKLFLRSLSDITEEHHDFLDDKIPHALSLKEFKEYIIQSPFFTPEEFKYMLKEKFDLFGLIESGLAVNAAELQTVNK